MTYPIRLSCLLMATLALMASARAQAISEHDTQRIVIRGDAGGERFDGIGIVEGGGATGPLLKDYPEPQRNQIMDMIFKPKFGASVSALYVEIPGDGNSTQGSMPSHMHSRDDLNYSRGYIWWELTEAKKRNPRLTLDATAWSAPGWIGDNGQVFAQSVPGHDIDQPFYSEDMENYYIKWLQGLKSVYGLELDAIGSRNEKGASYDFVESFRKKLNFSGFSNVKLHCCDNWPDEWRLNFVSDMAANSSLRDAIDIISTHDSDSGVQPEVRRAAAQMQKPLWDTELHVYEPGYQALIDTVHSFNLEYIQGGFTKIVEWYGIAGLYTLEPFSGEKEAALRANWPWSGNFEVNEKLWGFAHYGQFTEAGWSYVAGASGDLKGGGTFVTMKSPQNDYSVIIETSKAKSPQQLQLQVSGGLSNGNLAIWRSNAKEQFIRVGDLAPQHGVITLTVDPESVYSLTTTRGQQKGYFEQPQKQLPFPFPYRETFDEYSDPAAWGYLPRYFADIYGAFELTPCPKREGQCLRQQAPVRTLSWAPDWQPYTIIGDDQWQDYEVSSDIFLNAGEAAGVMGRVNGVGTGYGFIPKGYFLELSDGGQVRLVVVRGKIEKKKLVGDAEQQALIRASHDEGEGGEKVLAAAKVPGVSSGQWHNLKLRMSGDQLTGFVDGHQVLTLHDDLYGKGMAGLLAPAHGNNLSMPYFDELTINGVDKPTPEAAKALPGQQPMYQTKSTAK